MAQAALFEVEFVSAERVSRCRRARVSAVQLELVFPECTRRVLFSEMDNTQLALFVRRNNGHAEAREALIERNHKAVYRVANSSGLQVDDLEELANQLRWQMVRKTESAYNVHRIVRYEGWLMTVLTNKLKEIIRRENHKKRGQISIDEFEVIEGSVARVDHRPSRAQEFWESLKAHERDLLEWVGSRRNMSDKIRMTTVQKAVYDSIMRRGREIFGE